MVERLVVTEREQVETRRRHARRDRSQRRAGVLDAIDPAAKQIRADVSALMPQIKVEKARASARSK